MEIYEQIVALRSDREDFAICTVVDTSGSSPRKRGAKMIVRADGRIVGTIGGGAIEHDIIREAIEAMGQGENRLVVRHLTHELAMCCGGGMSVFVEVQSYRPRLYLFGCGHVGAALARFAADCGFEVRAIDARDDLAEAARQIAEPLGAQIICDEPLDVIETLDFDASDTFVVIVTHDHGLDEALVAAALERPTRYLGCIGSVRKGHKFRQRLAARGFEASEVERMRTPMGLDIGALTPEEIAVSVLAEMIAVRREGEQKSEAS